MNQKRRIQELHILKNNSFMPVIVYELNENDFQNKRVLKAEIEERELHSSSFFEGLLLSDKEKIFLLIEGIEALAQTEQEKFIPLLKDRRLGGKKLPDTVQIVLLMKEKKNLNQTLLKYCLM